MKTNFKHLSGETSYNIIKLFSITTWDWCQNEAYRRRHIYQLDVGNSIQYYWLWRFLLTENDRCLDVAKRWNIRSTSSTDILSVNWNLWLQLFRNTSLNSPVYGSFPWNNSYQCSISSFGTSFCYKWIWAPFPIQKQCWSWSSFGRTATREPTWELYSVIVVGDTTSCPIPQSSCAGCAERSSLLDRFAIPLHRVQPSEIAVHAFGRFGYEDQMVVQDFSTSGYMIFLSVSVHWHLQSHLANSASLMVFVRSRIAVTKQERSIFMPFCMETNLACAVAVSNHWPDVYSARSPNSHFWVNWENLYVLILSTIAITTNWRYWPYQFTQLFIGAIIVRLLYHMDNFWWRSFNVPVPFVWRRRDVVLNAWPVSECGCPTCKNANFMLSSTPTCKRYSTYDITYQFFVLLSGVVDLHE